MKKKPYWYLIFPILGVLFALYYVKRASSNIVYTDYIRLVNFYLPDVYDPSKFFVPDIVTRIPLNYLGRIINVALFSYSTTFDMILGVLGLGLSAWLLTWYAIRENLSAPWFLTMILFMFSLNKWEMLTNGTGWCHFAAFAGFYYHYILADRVLTGKERKGDRIQLLILPPILILLVSGPYCASYAVTLCLVHGMLYLIHLLKNKNLKSWHLWCLLSVLISMFFYLWSSSKADYSHSGATDLPFLTVLTQKPEMFVTFFLESFASMILGIEVIGGVIQTDTMICLLGLFVFAFYVLAFWLYFRNRLYEESYLPLFFMIAGLVNHGLTMSDGSSFSRSTAWLPGTHCSTRLEFWGFY
ncbi:MAG: hypothetical protein ACLTKI_06585 [Lachnospiraceae bacterium]